ncbi:hypothetical protein Hanom_Chr16g01474711 [Helianthus anomalus]
MSVIETYSRRRGPSFKKHHIHIHNFTFSFQTRLHQVKLRSPKPPHTLHTLQQILHRRIIIQLRPVTRRPNRLNHKPHRTPLGIKQPIMPINRRQPFIQHNPNIHFIKNHRIHKLLSPIMPTNLLIRNKQYINRPQRCEPRTFQVPYSLKVL